MTTGQGFAAERFAQHVAGLNFAQLSADAVSSAKTWILDTIGVGIAGSTADGMDRLRAAAARWGDGAEAAVWGTARRVPAPTAAFLNATQVHSQEFDCVHEGAVVHAMATLLPAAMAWAEREGGVSGRDLLLAVVAGVDVAAGLGLASTAEFRFFRPATAGGFGAAATIGRLAGFSAARIADAFGIQYAQTSGTMQPHVEGNAVLPMQIGFNARGALQSCDMASVGISGPRDVFEGRYGYFPLFEGTWDLTRVWRSLGREWQVCAISHKPYPAGRATHGGIEGIITLQAEHGFAPDEVEQVRVIGPKLINRLVGRPDMLAATASYARLCMAFMGAKALQHGSLDISHCRGAALLDPTTHELAARIVMQMDDNPDPNALAPQQVVIRLKTGKELTWHCETMLANPARPLTRAQHLAKFRRCWEFASEALGSERAEQLISIVEQLEQVSDLRELAALLVPRV